MTPQERAEKVAQSMLANDKASVAAGLKLVEIAPGAAKMTMQVSENHLNGHKICHGGYIYILADSCFAFACNSYNDSAVAYCNNITYLAPAKLGSLLTATAHEVSKIGRSGIYDVHVTDESGAIIAEFRGQSRIIRGNHFDESKEDK